MKRSERDVLFPLVIITHILLGIPQFLGRLKPKELHNPVMIHSVDENSSFVTRDQALSNDVSPDCCQGDLLGK